MPVIRHIPLYCAALVGLGCTIPKEADSGALAGQSCESAVTLEFPDGTSTSYDGCNNVLADATFEFDPDDPPEIRSFRLQLGGNVDEGFDCWLIFTASGICGSGYYDVGDGLSTSVQYQIHDCPGVSDDFEDTYTATEGKLWIEDASAGAEPGNFTGVPLLTTLSGAIRAEPESGVNVDVTFNVSVYIRGEDAEEITCDLAD